MSTKEVSDAVLGDDNISTQAEIQDRMSSGPTSLKRGLKSRHVGMISIAGAIGTGLVIGTGLGIARGGAGSMLIAFIFVGALVYNVMVALGEMATYIPMTKGFSGYAAAYVDPALGYFFSHHWLQSHLGGRT
jgi:amino acid transporter